MHSVTHARIAGRYARGMTLVEMAIASVIMLAVGALVVRFGMQTMRADAQERVSLAAQQNTRLAVNALSGELLLASSTTFDAFARLSSPAPNDGGVGDFGATAIQYRPVIWDQVTGQRLADNWREIRRNPLDPTLLERIIYTDNRVTIDPTQTLILARNLSRDEDADGNGVLDAGEDLNGDGRLQRGVWFQVDQEDDDDNETLTGNEDLNGNNLFDSAVLVRVDAEAFNTTYNSRGIATATTVVQSRNADPASDPIGD